MINFIKSVILKKTLFKLQNKLIRSGFEEVKPRISVFPFLSGDAFLALADVAILNDTNSPIVLREIIIR